VIFCCFRSANLLLSSLLLSFFIDTSCGLIAESCDLPCDNGGECLKIDSVDICLCPMNFWGKLCENGTHLKLYNGLLCYSIVMNFISNNC